MGIIQPSLEQLIKRKKSSPEVSVIITPTDQKSSLKKIDKYLAQLRLPYNVSETLRAGYAFLSKEQIVEIAKQPYVKLVSMQNPEHHKHELD